jgi:uncharacterized membrane protein YfcA
VIAYLVVGVTALFTAGLTMFSGFGLGTLLMPVFALFFPVEVAVGATAVVHGANNVFKIALVGRYADRSLVVRFGVPAILAAFAGAWALGAVAGFGELFRYELGARTAVVTPVKLAMGVLMLFFAVFELAPRFRRFRFGGEHLVAGGLLSGFFGGFSGHQGALRAAFLAKTATNTQTFVGTSATIGFMVDMARIATYALLYYTSGADNPLQPGQWSLIAVAIAAAFVGVLAGKRFLHKVTLATVQTLTGILLLVIALALGSGLI